MINKRFNSLDLLNANKELTGKLDLTEVGNEMKNGFSILVNFLNLIFYKVYGLCVLCILNAVLIDRT